MRLGWRRALRHFHLTGTGHPEASGAGDPAPLQPVALRALLGLEGSGHDYPLFMPEGAGSAPVPMAALLERSLDAASDAGASVSMLRDEIPRLARAFARAAREMSPAPIPIASAIAPAFEGVAAEFDVSEAGRAELGRQLVALQAQLPGEGSLLPLDPTLPVRLHVAALTAARRPFQAALASEVRSLALQLAELLRADALHGSNGAGAGGLATTLGAAGEDLIDARGLARTLPAHRGSVRIPSERRTRVEGCLAALRGHLDRGETPAVHLLHPGEVAVPEEVLGALVVEHPDALETAAEHFDDLVRGYVELFRAVRLARLEATGTYEPELHDDVLARLDWTAFTADELMAVPAVVVVEAGERLGAALLSALSQTLVGGRPIQVLATVPAGHGGRGSATGRHPGLGYLAASHRECFVVQSTLGRPEHLYRGLLRMAHRLRPGLALVATPSWPSPVPAAVQLAAAHHGRITPCFVHDPESGPTWADRIDLSDNPHPAARCSLLEQPSLDNGEASQAEPRPFTPAHAAALDPELRRCFRVIPEDAWDEEQVEVAEYLGQWEDGPALRVPFLWVVQADGSLARAVMTRELAFGCVDRLHAWRILQELGGIDNVWARRAAEAARAAALDEAERERQARETAHAEELARVRAEAGAETVERLVRVLMDEPGLPMTPASPAPRAVAPAPATSPSAAPPAAQEPAPQEEDEALLDEPYIDTPMCTTCNECTNLNPRLFVYDDNKQARLADVSAGTFADLVIAAEKCPARCIHPGAPRPGDATATDDMKARAAPFN
jgi:ferredoxin